MKASRFGSVAAIRLLLMLFMFAAAEGFGAPKKSPISLMVDDQIEKSEDEQEDVKEDNNGDEITTLTESETEICTLTVRIRNKGELPQVCKMEWYFISEKTTGDQSEKVIFESGQKEVSLPAGAAVEESVTSNPFVFTIVSKDRGDVDDQEAGDVYEGYAVLLTSKGKVLVGKGSSSRYLKPEWLDRYTRESRMRNL